MSAVRAVCAAAISLAASVLPMSHSLAEAPPILELQKLGRLTDGNRTVFAANPDGSLWSLYLKRNGEATFRYADDRIETANWTTKGDATICFDFHESDRLESSCWGVVPGGQGLNWVAQGEVRPDAQLIHLTAGRAAPDPNFYRKDMREWIGAVVIGRRLKSGKVWKATLASDGGFQFDFAESGTGRGAYFAFDDTICFAFMDPDRSTCRRAELVNGRIHWREPATETAGSEILYIDHGRKEVRPPPPGDWLHVRSRAACDANAERLRAACYAFAEGRLACGHRMGAGREKACQPAFQTLADGRIDPPALGLVQDLSVAPKSRRGSTFEGRIDHAARGGEPFGGSRLARQCARNIDRTCARMRAASPLKPPSSPPPEPSRLDGVPISPAEPSSAKDVREPAPSHSGRTPVERAPLAALPSQATASQAETAPQAETEPGQAEPSAPKIRRPAARETPVRPRAPNPPQTAPSFHWQGATLVGERNIRDWGPGVWVRSLRPGSLADRAGLRRTDQILQASLVRIADLDQLRLVISAAKLKGRQTILLQVNRAGKSLHLRFPLDR